MMRDILSGLVGMLLGVGLMVVMLPHPEPKIVLMPSVPAAAKVVGREPMLRAFETAHRASIVALQRRLGLKATGVISQSLLDAVAKAFP